MKSYVIEIWEHNNKRQVPFVFFIIFIENKTWWNSLSIFLFLLWEQMSNNKIGIFQKWPSSEWRRLDNKMDWMRIKCTEKKYTNMYSGSGKLISSLWNVKELNSIYCCCQTIYTVIMKNELLREMYVFSSDWVLWKLCNIMDRDIIEYFIN